MKSYKCILFDLDHTLWDYESNSEEALRELFDRYQLQQAGVTSFNYFFEVFGRINTGLWDLYDRGLIDQSVIRLERFQKVFSAAGLDEYKLSLQFSGDYLSLLPRKKNLLPGAQDILQYLRPRYPMGVVTNGFDEIQGTKLSSGGISHFFSTIVTSQRAGSKKPSAGIFMFALRELGFDPNDAIMIGDNLQTDIAGARSAGIDQVFFNPRQAAHDEKITHEIRTLSELRAVL